MVPSPVAIATSDCLRLRELLLTSCRPARWCTARTITFACDNRSPPDARASRVWWQRVCSISATHNPPRHDLPGLPGQPRQPGVGPGVGGVFGNAACVGLRREGVAQGDDLRLQLRAAPRSPHPARSWTPNRREPPPPPAPDPGQPPRPRPPPEDVAAGSTWDIVQQKPPTSRPCRNTRASGRPQAALTPALSTGPADRLPRVGAIPQRGRRPRTQQPHRRRRP